MDIPNLLLAFIDTAGPGGIVVIGVLVLALVVYTLLARWIIYGKGGK